MCGAIPLLTQRHAIVGAVLQRVPPLVTAAGSTPVFYSFCW